MTAEESLAALLEEIRGYLVSKGLQEAPTTEIWRYIIEGGRLGLDLSMFLFQLETLDEKGLLQWDKDNEKVVLLDPA